MEIALDYALQCSPDHPWVREHPDWFFVRPDGTFGFDENRRDPEDNGAWQCLHRFGGLVFDSMEHALAHAKSAVPWLANGA